jgi:hypothetical protein
MSSLIIIDSGGNDAFTKILMHFDGANGGGVFTDDNLGGSAHTWTRSGTTIFTSNTLVTPKFGVTALYQASSGASNYITTPDSADFTLGSGDFTFDFWINRSGDSTQRGICGQLSSDLLFFSFGMTCNADGSVTLNLGGVGTVATTTSILGASWHHVEFCRSGSTLYAFIDGNLDATAAASGSVGDVSTAWTIGRYGDYTSVANIAGGLDEFRLSVGIARHTAAFTPSTIPYF